MNRLKQLITTGGAIAALALLLAAPANLLAQAPAGATFKCKDGTYSTAKTQRGACSQHGGVAEAVAAAPAAKPAAAPAKAAPKAKAAAGAPAGATFKCGDGTYSTAKTSKGACSKHGGVAETLGAGTAAATTQAPAAAPAAKPAGKAAAAPAGGESATDATAQCKDGTYSHSQHRSGTCSQHGGVDKWLKEPAN